MGTPTVPPNDNIGFRLLRYEVRIWERWQAEHPGVAKLPVIVPVVLHHSETGWTGGTSFEDQLDADAATLAAVGPHVPRFSFVLEDIRHGLSHVVCREQRTRSG